MSISSCCYRALLNTFACVMVVTSTGAMAESTATTLDTQLSSHLLDLAYSAHEDGEVTVATNLPSTIKRLPACEEFRFDVRGAQRYGRLPVEVNCLAPNHWSIFVVAHVDLRIAVLVATRNIQRGELLTSANLGLARQSLSQLRTDYLTEIATVAGKEARRAIRRGTALNPGQYRAPVWVRRGEQIRIVAQRGSMNITTAGEALQDGQEGALIQVKNLSSARSIQAWVSAPGVVRTQRRQTTTDIALK